MNFDIVGTSFEAPLVGAADPEAAGVAVAEPPALVELAPPPTVAFV